ncbi:helix-turn-helix transcriptional regulator [Agrilutibacter solisilvae]|uniref:Helix-turn-helix transcriptional regulator n=1 Tax=Agrilutibacter solisilvae TaxID=2763317 RepID=A0A974XYY4_9GAMM|nr:AraC family transcriptional regulator [Lysobacter solisilvae]QSX78341.1 helix-turn-helix transcriptional regulator [Lysobacter solisilvae]
MPDTFVSFPHTRLHPVRQTEPFVSPVRPAEARPAFQPAPAPLPLRLAVFHRADAARAPAAAFTFWLQLRGCARIAGAEGAFTLHAGDWIAFERGSQPELQGGRTGLTVALMLTPDLMAGLLEPADRGLLPGRGVLAAPERRMALRLGRACALPLERGDQAAVLRALRPLLQHLQAAQQDFAALVERCPGRSFHRKTRIFARIQKARMYLEGNPQRMLRIEELMELTRFSSWWLSKTFHAVYQETLQRASMRLRMQRARQLLQEGQLSISELAEACGFHDPCSFARQFKATHGQTASAWRARHMPESPVGNEAAGSAAALH